MSLKEISYSLLRNGLAVMAGVGAGSALNMRLIQYNTSVLYPMPPGVDFIDQEAFGMYISDLPPLAFGVIFLAHYGQAVVGGYVAAQLATTPESGTYCSYLVGTLTFVGSAMMAATLPAPAWTWVELPLFPILIYYTGKWAAEYPLSKLWSLLQGSREGGTAKAE